MHSWRRYCISLEGAQCFVSTFTDAMLFVGASCHSRREKAGPQAVWGQERLQAGLLLHPHRGVQPPTHWNCGPHRRWALLSPMSSVFHPLSCSWEQSFKTLILSHRSQRRPLGLEERRTWRSTRLLSLRCITPSRAGRVNASWSWCVRARRRR